MPSPDQKNPDGLPSYALTGVNIVDVVAGAIVTGKAVVIGGGKIVAITDEASLDPGLKRVDLRGRYLSPGLIDCHAHVYIGAFNDGRSVLPSEMTARAGLHLSGMLHRGFTTIRDAGGADQGHRAAQEKGLFKGPRMFVAGRILSQTGGHGDHRGRAEFCNCGEALGGVGIIADGVDEVRKAVRENIRQGCDHIKIMAGGGVSSPGDKLVHPQYSLEEITAIADEATRSGRYVMAHVYSDIGIRRAVSCGVRSIEHGNLITEEAAIAVRDADAWLVPTLAVYEALSRHGKEFNIPPFQLQKVEAARNSGLRGLEIAYRAGLKIGTGTDLLGTMVKYQPMELELKAEVMTPMESLLSATRTNAELMRMADLTGTVEPGKYADLIVVEGNPLKEIALFQDPARMLMVMKAGRIYRNLL